VVAKDLGIRRRLIIASGLRFSCKKEIQSTITAKIWPDSETIYDLTAIDISRQMRPIVLQSAVGGMALSVAGMLLAALGHLNPVSRAISQEIIDFLAVLNALRAAASSLDDSTTSRKSNEREHHETKIQNG
jgi:hypothetical protein